MKTVQIRLKILRGDLRFLEIMQDESNSEDETYPFFSDHSHCIDFNTGMSLLVQKRVT